MACRYVRLGLPEVRPRPQTSQQWTWARRCSHAGSQPPWQRLQRRSHVPAEDESQSTQGASNSSNKSVDTGLLPILGSMLAILASVAVLYVAAFSLGSGLVVQFKDQIGGVMKKDFVPYSERKALEYRLLEQRLSEAVSPPGSESQAIAGSTVPRDQDFLTLLPK